MTDKPSFASRWSERKRAVQAEAEEINEVTIEDAPVVEDDRTDAEILDELGLKNPDDLVQGDDFSAFMKSAVPAHLKNRALRKLWTSNPVLACVDGLNDYDGDFTDAANPMTAIKSAYEVGKGYAAKILREDEEAAVLALESDDSPVTEAALPQIETEPEGNTEEIEQLVTNSTEGFEIEDEVAQLQEEPVFPRRKRMSFDFS